MQEPTPVSLRKESSSVMELVEITIGPEADPPSLLSTVQEQPGGVCTYVPDSYAQRTHQFLMRMLSVRISS
jgi:hypothetical protein